MGTKHIERTLTSMATRLVAALRDLCELVQMQPRLQPVPLRLYQSEPWMRTPST